MSWASNRRLLIIAGILFVVIIVLIAILALTLPEKPTCTDGFQNQDEQGVDCGGSCAYLCKSTLAEPLASDVRALKSHGRIDVVGLVENRNPSAAAEDASYIVEVFSPEGVLVASTKGTMDLPSGETVPFFVPGIAPSDVAIGQAFLTFDDATLNWVRNQQARTLLRADAIQSAGTVDAPRVTANLFNSSPYFYEDVTVVAIVYDIYGTVTAATKTIAESIQPGASLPITFTWNEPFSAPPGRIDVRAVVPLP